MKSGPDSALNLANLKQVLNWTLTDWQYQKFLDKGIIFIQGAIDEEMSSEFSYEMMHLTKIEPPMEDGVRKPIWIILDSCGGIIVAGLAIYDTIKAAVSSGAEVNIIGRGIVASMASVIIQAGTRRFSLPHTQFLVHEVSQSVSEADEKVSEGEERVQENKRINRIIMEIIAERAGTGVDELIKLSKKKDCWFDASGARGLGANGLIDEIITAFPF
jgi:ATP-dependent Clp endopeptidase proteolytic subunit ClpP